MVLNLTSPEKEKFELWAEITLDIQEELQWKIPEVTREIVMQIIHIMNENSWVLQVEAKELVQFAVRLYILWIDKVTKEHSLETKERILDEIEDLKENPKEATKVRVDALREKLFLDMTAMDIHVKTSVSTDEVNTYFFNNGWSSNMPKRLFEWLKGFVEKNY